MLYFIGHLHINNNVASKRAFWMGFLISRNAFYILQVSTEQRVIDFLILIACYFSECMHANVIQTFYMNDKRLLSQPLYSLFDKFAWMNKYYYKTTIVLLASTHKLMANFIFRNKNCNNDNWAFIFFQLSINLHNKFLTRTNNKECILLNTNPIIFHTHCIWIALRIKREFNKWISIKQNTIHQFQQLTSWISIESISCCVRSLFFSFILFFSRARGQTCLWCPFVSFSTRVIIFIIIVIIMRKCLNSFFF